MLVNLLSPAMAMQGAEKSEESEFAIVFAAMGVNMETAHFFKQVRVGSIAWITGRSSLSKYAWLAKNA